MRASDASPGPGGGTVAGSVVFIHLAAEKRDRVTPVECARLVAREGIEGDRYFGREERRNVTLVEQERLMAACEAIGVPYRPGCSRRNITVRDIDLNALVGREFMIGDARLVGHELCEPCALMETSIGPGARETLVHQAGIRAVVLEGGEIRPGDRIRPIDDPSRPGRTPPGKES